jgi:hypothetical protein
VPEALRALVKVIDSAKEGAEVRAEAVTTPS